MYEQAALTSNNGTYVFCFVKDGHTYWFRFVTKTVAKVVRQCTRFAMDPDLNFNFHDAEFVYQAIRNL